jgi:WD40 repeat protein
MRLKNLLLILLLAAPCIAFSQVEPRLVLPVGHTGNIDKYVFTADSKYIITQSSDHTVRIWDALTGLELRVIEGVKSSGGEQVYETKFEGAHLTLLNTSLANFDYAPLTKKIITSFGDNTVQLSDFNSSKIEMQFKGHDLPISHLAFSKDEKFIATASLDSSIIIWEVQTGKKIASLIGHQNWVNSVEFSADSKQLLSASYDGMVIVWDIQSMMPIKKLDVGNGVETAAYFENDNAVVTISTRSRSLNLWSLVSDEPIFEYKIDRHSRVIVNAEVLNEGNKILMQLGGKIVRLIDYKTNSIVKELRGVNSALSPDNRYLALCRSDTLCIYDLQTWNVRESILPKKAGKIVFSPDSRKMAIDFYDSSIVFDVDQNSFTCSFGRGKSRKVHDLKAEGSNHIINTVAIDATPRYGYREREINKIWDLETGKNEAFHQGIFGNFKRTPQGVIYTFSKDSVHFYDFESGRFIQKFKNYSTIRDKNGKVDYRYLNNDSVENINNSIFHEVIFSNDFKWMFTIEDSNIRVWNVLLGQCEHLLKGQLGEVGQWALSPDCTFLVSTGGTGRNEYGLLPYEVGDTTIRIWDFKKGKQIATIKGKGNNFYITSDSKYILVYADSTISIWDIKLKKVIRELEGHKYGVSDVILDHINKHVVSLGMDSTIRYWDFDTGECIKIIDYKDRLSTLKIHPKINEFYFYDSRSYMLTSINFENPIKIKHFEGHTDRINSELFLSDSNKLLTSSNDYKTILWDIETGKPLYTRLQLEGDDWLAYDTNYRFDGTPGAIEKLYFVCGLEVVELNQVKDSLYVPNLVQRIMNGENLDHLPKLSELNICGVTPLVEPIEEGNGRYRYHITPRSGGLGDIEVYINGVIRQKENAKNFQLTDGKYLIEVNPELIQRFQLPGEPLQVKVIAKTANNSISSRGVVLELQQNESSEYRKPSLHAVMIGVDDYKDNVLDLNYAAKDANDLHIALEESAKKLFNVDDTNRVFFYNLTVDRNAKIGTSGITSKTPDRLNILKTLEEIEKKSKPEDILLLFFAGHGEIVDKDQLLLLTTESTSSSFEGIRMRELLEQLNKIPAGKRVLILDACHSGAAINNMDLAQFTGKRDVKDAERQSQRLKELDKLASKSGFAIITASSSDQKALELPQYEHGLMTYALLNAMLNNKNSLDENNQLQLDKWLLATEEEVKKLNLNQSAERMVPVSFPIGKIDEEVRSSIVLKEIPTVFVNNVINSDLGFDDLEIKQKLLDYFIEKSRSADKTVFVTDAQQPGSLQVNVQYNITKGEVQLKLTLLKNKEVLRQLQQSGNVLTLDQLMKGLVQSIEVEMK